MKSILVGKYSDDPFFIPLTARLDPIKRNFSFIVRESNQKKGPMFLNQKHSYT